MYNEMKFNQKTNQNISSGNFKFRASTRRVANGKLDIVRSTAVDKLQINHLHILLLFPFQWAFVGLLC